MSTQTPNVPKRIVINQKEEESKLNHCETFMKGLRYMAYIISSIIAVFWISKVFENYLSYPVYTKVTLIDNNTFNWPSITVCSHTMPWKTCAKELKDMLNFCTYDRYDSEINDCRNKSSDLGHWRSYKTQHETCHTFTPIPTHRKVDSIELGFDFDSCNLLRGAIHPAEEVYN